MKSFQLILLLVILSLLFLGCVSGEMQKEKDLISIPTINKNSSAQKTEVDVTEKMNASHQQQNSVPEKEFVDYEELLENSIEVKNYTELMTHPEKYANKIIHLVGKLTHVQYSWWGKGVKKGYFIVVTGKYGTNHYRIRFNSTIIDPKKMQPTYTVDVLARFVGLWNYTDWLGLKKKMPMADAIYVRVINGPSSNDSVKQRGNPQ